MDDIVDTASLPWIPLGPGESFKPLRFLPDDRGRALLLRLEPGLVVPRHRHLGEVHVFNVVGKRQLDTGHVVGPGGYPPRASPRSFCRGRLAQCLCG